MAKNRRPNFTLITELKIPAGSILHFKNNSKITCKVILDRLVFHEGFNENFALSRLSRILLDKEDENRKKSNGILYWYYENELLEERRYRLENELAARKEEDKEYQELYDSLKKQGLSETEREAVVKVRIGQGLFREGLYERWQGCSVTGYQRKEMLIASHIKPWSKSEKDERINTDNGLLLTANLDKAFDRGFITFEDDGKIRISEDLDNPETLGINQDMRLGKRFNDKNKKYLKYHREKIFLDRDVAEEENDDKNEAG